MPGINLIITTQADVSQDVLLEYIEARLNNETPELFDHYLTAIEAHGITTHRKQPRPPVPGYPGLKETTALLNQWEMVHNRMETHLRRFADGLGVSIAESPVFEATWGVFDSYTKTLGQLLGDTDSEWLTWYWLENDMGRKGHEAGYDQAAKPIHHAADLAELILEGRNWS